MLDSLSTESSMRYFPALASSPARKPARSELSAALYPDSRW
jgi:hypothetical protein